MSPLPVEVIIGVGATIGAVTLGIGVLGIGRMLSRIEDKKKNEAEKRRVIQYQKDLARATELKDRHTLLHGNSSGKILSDLSSKDYKELPRVE